MVLTSNKMYFISLAILSICLRILLSGIPLFSNFVRTTAEFNNPTASFDRFIEGSYLMDLGIQPTITKSAQPSPLLFIILSPIRYISQQIAFQYPQFEFLPYILVLSLVDILIACAILKLVQFYAKYPVIVPLSITTWKEIMQPVKGLCGPSFTELNEEVIMNTINRPPEPNKIQKIVNKCRRKTKNMKEADQDKPNEENSNSSISTSTQTNTDKTILSRSPQSKTDTLQDKSLSSSQNTNITSGSLKKIDNEPTKSSNTPSLPKTPLVPVLVDDVPDWISTTIFSFLLFNPLSVSSTVALNLNNITYVFLLWAFVFVCNSPVISKNDLDKIDQNPSNSNLNTALISPSISASIFAAFAFILSPPFFPLIFPLVCLRIYVLGTSADVDGLRVRKIINEYIDILTEWRDQREKSKKISEIKKSDKIQDEGDEHICPHVINDNKPIKSKSVDISNESHENEHELIQRKTNINTNTNTNNFTTYEDDVSITCSLCLPSSNLFKNPPPFPPITLTSSKHNQFTLSVNILLQFSTIIISTYSLYYFTSLSIPNGFDSFYDFFYLFLSHPVSLPSPGIVWYFFPQLFPRFTLFFAVILSIVPLFLTLIIIARFYMYPFLQLCLIFPFIIILKYSPSYNDIPILLMLMLANYPLIRHRLRNLTLVYLLLAQLIVGSFAAYYVWMLGSGNANFSFFQTVGISLCLVILDVEIVSSVRRLQSIAPGVMIAIGDIYGEWVDGE